MIGLQVRDFAPLKLEWSQHQASLALTAAGSPAVLGQEPGRVTQ